MIPPHILSLTEQEKRHALICAHHGYQRLNAGEPIEALTLDEVAGLVLDAQARLSMFVGEVERRRKATLT